MKKTSAKDATGSTARPGDSDETAYKTDHDKSRLDEIPGQALWELAKVYSHGIKKYPPGNWRKDRGMAWSRPYGALWRHILAWQGGERDDKESGVHHLAHAIWNLITLMLYDLWGWKEKDDVRGDWFGEKKNDHEN